jgi:hypothetical protein
MSKGSDAWRHASSGRNVAKADAKSEGWVCHAWPAALLLDNETKQAVDSQRDVEAVPHTMDRVGDGHCVDDDGDVDVRQCITGSTSAQRFMTVFAGHQAFWAAEIAARLH